MNTEQITTEPVTEKEDKNYKVKAGLFLTSVAGASMLFGFSTALASAKRKEASSSLKAQQLTSHAHHLQQAQIAAEGSTLALRALGWGSFYAVTGCGLLFYAIWKMMGVKDLKEFRTKVGGVLPSIPKNSPPQGRTEFESLTDLLQYISDEDDKLNGKKRAE